MGKPNPSRQASRIEPQFRKLVTAFEAQRAKMGVGISDEVDPNLVIVFDLAGSVKDFCNAINKIEGLEFLSEFVGDVADPGSLFSCWENMVRLVVGRTLFFVSR